MFGFSPKLPISEEERQWVDEGFKRLEKLLGRRRMLEAQVILPIPDYFTDPYDKSPESVEMLFQRVCGYMGVDRRRIDLRLFAAGTDRLRSILPYWRGNAAGCAGFYRRDPNADADGHGESRMLVALRGTQTDDPLLLVATMAHELGHVILLGGELISPETPDHEPLTDLLTVFLGFGIFNANSAGRFKQFQNETHYGWSMQRLGYLAEEVYGYALAKFATERGEKRPAWEKHMSTNVRAYYKRSRSWLAKNKYHVTMAKPFG